MQSLVSIRMIKAVDASSLDQPKEKALSLQQAYNALRPEERTKTLCAEYLTALKTLLDLIQVAKDIH